MTNLLAIAVATNLAGQVVTTTGPVVTNFIDNRSPAHPYAAWEVVRRRQTNDLHFQWFGARKIEHVGWVEISRKPVVLNNTNFFLISTNETAVLLPSENDTETKAVLNTNAPPQTAP